MYYLSCRSNELKKNLDLKSNQTTNAPNRRRSLAETLRWASMGHIGSKKETPETPPTPSSPSQPPSITHSSPSNTHPPLTHPPLTHPLTHPPITHPLSLTHPPSLTLSHPPSPLYSHSLNKYLDDSPYINESPRHDDRHYLPKAKRGGVKRVRLTMYNFGSPRVGNGFFALLYNRCVPDSFRTVIDGDLVTSMPPTGYRHIGTQAVVDNLGAGSIIIDPSFIERRLRTHTKSSVSVHSLLVYRKVCLRYTSPSHYHPLFLIISLSVYLFISLSLFLIISPLSLSLFFSLSPFPFSSTLSCCSL